MCGIIAVARRRSTRQPPASAEVLALIDPVLDLLADPERRIEMGRQARNFAAQYDWRQVAPLLDNVYARVLDAEVD